MTTLIKNGTIVTAGDTFKADLLIDDVILYEAAAADEKRPFPKRVVFTAWFDTGKQGKEWPGEFEVINHEKPRTWKCAKSVKGPDDEQVIRVGPMGGRLFVRAAHCTGRTTAAAWARAAVCADRMPPLPSRLRTFAVTTSQPCAQRRSSALSSPIIHNAGDWMTAPSAPERRLIA